jgi:hypothetical protein
MKYPHSIPLWRTNEQLLPGSALSRVVINIGHSTTWEFKKEGWFRRFFKARGAISAEPQKARDCGLRV